MDRKRIDKTIRNPWLKSRRIEEDYARQLRGVAREVGRIVNAFPAGEIEYLSELIRSLNAYSEALKPWAKMTARRVLSMVVEQDDDAWKRHSREMGIELRKQIETAPIGETLRKSLDQQVELITSLPIEAGQRVHQLTTEAQWQGTRAKDIAAEIKKTGAVTASRATLIARTEVSRTSQELVQARAEHIGSPGYIWHTAHDSDVRPEHKKMDGKFVRWDSPPTLKEGNKEYTFHAGCIFNCRCWAEPVAPEF